MRMIAYEREECRVAMESIRDDMAYNASKIKSAAESVWGFDSGTFIKNTRESIQELETLLDEYEGYANRMEEI